MLIGGAFFFFLARLGVFSTSPNADVAAKADYGSNSRYARCYKTNPELDKLPEAASASGKAQGIPQCKFLLSAKKQLQRDYVLIVDRSGSMSTHTRWADAEKAVATLAPYICKFDPDGIDLIFFDHEVIKFDGVKDPTEVKNLFKSHQPRGSTNLALALHSAFRAHFAGERGATTILVVTDGAPDSRQEVERVIRRAAESIEVDAELSVSFIQIGTDLGAKKFLQYLDDDLKNVKFDIVDTVTAEECNNLSFAELIARSIYD